MIVAGTLAPRAAFAAEAADAADWGLQLGGPAVFEVVYRPRVGGPVLLEVGAFLVGGGGFIGNASLGVLVELGQPSSAQPYVAFGGGGAQACGEGEDGLSCGGFAYGYTRLGVAMETGPDPPSSNLVTFDVGGWLGGIDDDDRGFRRFIIPMVGVGYYW